MVNYVTFIAHAPLSSFYLCYTLIFLVTKFRRFFFCQKFSVTQCDHPILLKIHHSICMYTFRVPIYTKTLTWFGAQLIQINNNNKQPFTPLLIIFVLHQSIYLWTVCKFAFYWKFEWRNRMIIFFFYFIIFSLSYIFCISLLKIVYNKIYVCTM